MRKIAFYCSGRNELPPEWIGGVQFFPDRAFMWDELAKRIPDAEISVYFTPPGEFTADMGLKITRFPERVSYVLLDGTETVEEIAEKIAGDHPDLAIAFSIPVLPFDWAALRDAMVGKELRQRGVRTICHSVRFTYDSFEKNRLSDDLRKNGFNVARSVTVQNDLYHAHLADPSITQIEEFEKYGMWDVAGYFVSDEPYTAETAAVNYKALMCGEGPAYELSAINTWKTGENDGDAMDEIRKCLSRFVHPRFIYCTNEEEDQEDAQAGNQTEDQVEGQAADQDDKRCEVYINAAAGVSGKELTLHLGFPRAATPGLSVSYCTGESDTEN